MSRVNNNKSGTFLIEMLIVILFFSLVSALCIRLFAQAKLTTIQGNELARATAECQTAAECFKAVGSDEELFAQMMGLQKTDDGYIAYYDEGWEKTEEAAKRRLCINITEKELIYTANIGTYSGEEEIYSLTVKNYQPQE